jgi:hypothetical protein
VAVINKLWKANGKTTILQLFPDSLSPKNMRDASSGDELKIALFGELSLEEAMDLSRDRQILEHGHGPSLPHGLLEKENIDHGSGGARNQE